MREISLFRSLAGADFPYTNLLCSPQLTPARLTSHWGGGSLAAPVLKAMITCHVS